MYRAFRNRRKNVYYERSSPILTRQGNAKSQKRLFAPGWPAARASSGPGPVSSAGTPPRSQPAPHWSKHPTCQHDTHISTSRASSHSQHQQTPHIPSSEQGWCEMKTVRTAVNTHDWKLGKPCDPFWFRLRSHGVTSGTAVDIKEGNDKYKPRCVYHPLRNRHEP